MTKKNLMPKDPRPGQKMPNGTVAQGNKGNGKPTRPSRAKK